MPVVTRQFSFVIGMLPIGGFKNRFVFVGPTLAQKFFGRCFLIIHLTIVLGPKLIFFFFFFFFLQLKEKTWWLVSGANVASSYFL